MVMPVTVRMCVCMRMVMHVCMLMAVLVVMFMAVHVVMPMPVTMLMLMLCPHPADGSVSSSPYTVTFIWVPAIPQVFPRSALRFTPEVPGCSFSQEILFGLLTIHRVRT